MIDPMQWAKYIPPSLHEQYISEEAHACSTEVQAWIESDNDQQLMEDAMHARSTFLQKFMLQNNISTKVLNLTTLSTADEFKLRVDIIRKNQERLMHLVTNDHR